MKPFIYHAANNEIVEKIPVPQTEQEYLEDVYESSVYSERGFYKPKRHPCHPSCKEVWKDGEEKEQYKHFYITDGIVHPIQLKFTQQESEEELWAAMFKQLGFNVWRQVDIDQLKQHFTISRKTTQQ